MGMPEVPLYPRQKAWATCAAAVKDASSWPPQTMISGSFRCRADLQLPFVSAPPQPLAERPGRVVDFANAVPVPHVSLSTRNRTCTASPSDDKGRVLTGSGGGRLRQGRGETKAKQRLFHGEPRLPLVAPKPPKHKPIRGCCRAGYPRA
ncbi:hypothetical protein RJ55_06313 [Drechmeria coniospora]|nr:hypothetical protein RJ55_06313 [Drechmeria coniospora]